MTRINDIKQKFFADIDTVPASLQSSYYPSLDGLRGIAILMVLLAHFGVNKLLFPLPVYIDSTTGVHIFFILSGFLITTLLLKEQCATGSISLKYFYIRRVLRIIPLLWLFVLVLFTLSSYYHSRVTLMDYLSSLLFFKNLPVQSSYYSAHFWSLAVEEQFYLTFPFLLVYNVNKYLLVALCIVIGVPVISIIGYNYPAMLHINIIVTMLVKAAMYSFWKGPVMILVGSVASILTFKGVVSIKPDGKSCLGIMLLLLAIVIATPNFVFYSKYIAEYVSAILVAWAILLFTSNKGCSVALLNNKVLRKVGVLSYSIYMWQQLFVGSNCWQPWLATWRTLPLYTTLPLKLTCVFIIAGVSYYLFELRFLRLKRRFNARRKRMIV